MRRHLVVIIASITLLVMPIIWGNTRNLASATKSATQPAQAAAQANASQPCNSKSFPQMKFMEAKDSFQRLGLSPRSAGKVRNIRDMVGAVMYLNGSWLYITDVEYRYDPKHFYVAISRLEGYYADGEYLRVDKSDKLPSSFQVVDNLSQLGPVIMNIGDKWQTIDSFKLNVNARGALVFSVSKSGDVKTQDTGTCQMHYGGNCAGWGCTSSCKAVPGDPCDCSGIGFCYLTPGGSCQGECPSEQGCRAFAPNPGAIICGCAPLAD